MIVRLALAAALVFAASSCSKLESAAHATPAGPAKPPPIQVETATVQKRPMPRYLALTGGVLADRESAVAANVSGRITATQAERGQQVKAGQVIAIVDSKAAGFSAAAAEAQLQAAETQVRQAEIDCQRAETLFSSGSIPKAEYDRMKSQCTAQLYQSAAARANANLASKLAGDTLIRAPIDGVVGERFVNVGEYVQPPSRVATVVSVDPVRVSISVPETAVSQIHDGQSLNVTVAAWPDRSFPARVKYISPALRPNTRDLVVEAVAPNPDGALKPGMFATVRLLVGEQEQPTVPADAIQAEGMVKRLFLVKNGAAFEVVVRTGETKEGRVAIFESLEPGALVIRKPPAGLRDGSPIQ